MTMTRQNSMHASALEQEVQKLKQKMSENGAAPRAPREKLSKLSLNKESAEESHPLLRRIENVMSKYAKKS